MRTSHFRFVAASIVGLAIAATTAAAQAKEQFPGDIERNLGLDYTPPCRLCHVQGTTGAGSVAAPFGISMLAHGMTGSGSSLPAALAAMQTDMTDSDGDGKPDIDELIGNTDPNTPADVPLVSEDPRYGCSVATVNRAAQLREGSITLLFLVAVLSMRSRRRHRRH